MKSYQQILKERGLDDYGRVQRFIDSEVIRLMEPYTPKESGTGIDTATQLTDIGSGEVRQGGAKAPYMKKWYYTKANFQQDSGGRSMNGTRGNYWFERMKQNGGKKKILQGAIREAGAKK